MTQWLTAFLWTCALEQPVYVLMTRRGFKRWWEPCLLNAAVNALTHPLVWTLALGPGTRAWDLAALELMAILIEGAVAALCLRRALPPREAWTRGLGAAAAANLASVMGGMALGRIRWWVALAAIPTDPLERAGFTPSAR